MSKFYKEEEIVECPHCGATFDVDGKACDLVIGTRVGTESSCKTECDGCGKKFVAVRLEPDVIEFNKS